MTGEPQDQDDDAGARAFNVFATGMLPPAPTSWPDERRMVNTLSDKPKDSVLARIARANLFAKHGAAMPAPTPAPTPAPRLPPAPPMPAPKTNARRRMGWFPVWDTDPVERTLMIGDAKVSYQVALPRWELRAYDEPPPDVPEELHPESPYISKRRHRIVEALRAHDTLTAEHLAKQFAVVPRTVYRDIADMQLMGLPIVAVAGRGYAWRPAK
jgi:hypothetical protein